MNPTDRVIRFVRELSWDDLSPELRHQTQRCLLDGLGALIGGTRTPAAGIAARTAETQFRGREATVLGKGGRASAVGAVLANGIAANALDIDDGYRLVKGHPGACVLPVVLTAAETASSCSGAEFLTALAIGYELGIRAGRIRHALAETYHSSGSWGAVAGAAAAGRILGLGPGALRHAMGAAEYHAPIAPMMKGIAVPSMGKDSTGWGAMVAMLATLMAREGFTGIEPLFSEAPNPGWIENLGRDWQIFNLYFKPYAACRWAQPAVDAALTLQARHDVTPAAIRAVRIRTFAAACALRTDAPRHTEDAQYNMAYPVAAALLDGVVGAEQVLAPRIFDRDVVALAGKVTTEVHPPYEAAFPEKTFADVVIETRDGRRWVSPRTEPRWEPPDRLPGDDELQDKFRALAAPVLGDAAAGRLRDAVWRLDTFQRAADLIPLCCASIARPQDPRETDDDPEHRSAEREHEGGG